MLLKVCDSGMRQSGLAQLMDWLDGLVLIHINTSIRYYYCVWPPLEKMKAETSLQIMSLSLRNVSYPETSGKQLQTQHTQQKSPKLNRICLMPI